VGGPFEARLTRNTPKAKTPLERAKLLENTLLFKSIHAETAETGQTAPPKDLNVDLHFTCFVEAPDASVRTLTSGQYSNRLIELDGSRDGPMDHGRVDDFLKVRNSPSGFF
jgi:ubiquitin carboxyl-terminal hydrolase L3